MIKKKLIKENKKLIKQINWMSENWSKDYKRLSNKIICLKKNIII